MLPKSPRANLDLATLKLVLRRYLHDKTILTALQILYDRLGFFQIPLPGFHAYVAAGPATNRQILVTDSKKLQWRSPNDPVTELLQHGVLVVDGEEHDRYRSLMEPFLGPGYLPNYVRQMLRHVDRVTSTWQTGQTVDMLVECRRIALLILMDTLFSVDFWDDMPRLWTSILKVIEYISPGPWLIFPQLPRFGYRKHIKLVDEMLYRIISTRRRSTPRHDLLDHLIAADLEDSCIRDQMLTLLIAGHDTSTSLLAWTFYLLGQNPGIYSRLQFGLDEALHGELPTAPTGWQPHLLDEIIKESLRLYPPIHLGNRWVKEEIELEGHQVHAQERLLYSIYLTHRDPKVWENPDQFIPERYAHGRKQPPFAYVPFGGGPRACIGAAFGLVEARLVIARLLQTYQFQLVNPKVHIHMGATLEPKPGVMMRVYPKA